MPWRSTRVAEHAAPNEARRTMDAWLLARVALGESWGIDMIPLHETASELDAATLRWVDDNRYFSEIASRRQTVARGMLYALRAADYDVYSYAANVLEPTHMHAFTRRTGARRFDIVAFDTMLYMLTEDQRAAAILAVKDQASPDALVKVQDFAAIDPDDPTKLCFYENIYAPESQYGLFVRSMHADTEPWERLGHFNNGRCEIFYPSDSMVRRALGATAVGGSVPQAPERYNSA